MKSTESLSLCLRALQPNRATLKSELCDVDAQYNARSFYTWYSTADNILMNPPHLDWSNKMTHNMASTQSQEKGSRVLLLDLRLAYVSKHGCKIKRGGAPVRS